MNINNYNQISFGQKVPTGALLKIGGGVYDYDDAKTICTLLDKKFPGHVGYYKKATQHVKNIAEKNNNINQIFDSINDISNKNDKLAIIRKIVMKIGKEIDVKV